MYNPEFVNIEGLSKAAVLAVLWNNSAPGGMGFLQAQHGPDVMTEEIAEQLLETGSLDPGSSRITTNFDYLFGRPMKLDLSDDEMLDPQWYDRDNGGPGTAQKLIEHLRETGSVTSPEIEDAAKVRAELNAHEAMEHVNTLSSMDDSGRITVFTLGADELAEPLEKAVDKHLNRVRED